MPISKAETKHEQEIRYYASYYISKQYREIIFSVEYSVLFLLDFLEPALAKVPNHACATSLLRSLLLQDAGAGELQRLLGF